MLKNIIDILNKIYEDYGNVGIYIRLDRQNLALIGSVNIGQTKNDKDPSPINIVILEGTDLLYTESQTIN